MIGSKHFPNQPVELASDGAYRFIENKLVVHLLDEASNGRKCDLNDLDRLKDISNEEWDQLYQLIGTSLQTLGNNARTERTRKYIDKAWVYLDKKHA